MIRREHESPESITSWGWKYHHLGVPTIKKMPNKKYLCGSVELIEFEKSHSFIKNVAAIRYERRL